MQHDDVKAKAVTTVAGQCGKMKALERVWMVSMDEYKECMKIEKDAGHNGVYLILADAAITETDYSICIRMNVVVATRCIPGSVEC